jgi:hypothetical protein
MTITHKQMEALRPLLDTKPNDSLYFIGNADDDTGRWVCLGCGVSKRQLMITRHKKGCPHAAHWAAIMALRDLLESKK